MRLCTRPGQLYVKDLKSSPSVLFSSIVFLFTAALIQNLFGIICTQQPTAGRLILLLHCVCPALCTSHYNRTNSPQAVAAVREEDLTLLGVLPGHARRMLLRLPSLRAAAVLPVDGGAAAAAAAIDPASTAAASAMRLS